MGSNLHTNPLVLVSAKIQSMWPTSTSIHLSMFWAMLTFISLFQLYFSHCTYTSLPSIFFINLSHLISIIVFPVTHQSSYYIKLYYRNDSMLFYKQKVSRSLKWLSSKWLLYDLSLQVFSLKPSYDFPLLLWLSSFNSYDFPLLTLLTFLF